MWKAIESLKDNKADISLSAGNTGALLSYYQDLLLNTIDGIINLLSWFVAKIKII